MAAVVKLQNGETIKTEDDPQKLADRFNASRRDGTLIKVDGEEGAVWINPHVLATIAPERESVNEQRGVLGLGD